jgi:hypothetical protein
VKYPVRQFKSMEIALKEMEPFVKNGAQLQTGKRLKKFGDMLPREVWANWLLGATINAVEERQLTFSTDSTSSDGIIRDEKSNETFPTEHVMVPRQSASGCVDAQTLIWDAINQKRRKGGAAYARGKTLVVFLDVEAGQWFPNKVARALPDPLYFATVWVVALKGVEDGAYVYYVTHLDLSDGNAPTFTLRISEEFETWQVADVQ